MLIVATILEIDFATDLEFEMPPDENDLRQQFWKLNHDLIIQRLDNIVDQNSYILTRRELIIHSTGKTQAIHSVIRNIDIFDGANRRLLIVGEPGSGKTTELLQLAVQLSEKAETEESAPIPVILELAAWRGEPMVDWIGDQIQARYGVQQQTSKKWLHLNHFAILLDGLDDLDPEQAAAAIQAINQLQPNTPHRQMSLVVCSQAQHYKRCYAEYGVKLTHIDQIVRMCDLDEKQIWQYLDDQRAQHLWSDLVDHAGWRGLAQRPMSLSLMPLAFAPSGALPLTVAEQETACQAALFEAVLANTLTLPEASAPFPDAQQARDYLVWLAAKLEALGEREFLIERLQPYWLGSPQQRQQYQLMVGLLGGLAVGLIFGLMGFLMYGLTVGLMAGLAIGLVGGRIIRWRIGTKRTIQLVDPAVSGWQKRQLKRGRQALQALFVTLFIAVLRVIQLSGGAGLMVLVVSLAAGGPGVLILLIIGLFPLALIENLITWINNKNQDTDEVLSAIMNSKLGKLSGAALNSQERPNQGIQETAIAVVLAMSLAVPLCALLYAVANWVMGQTLDLSIVLAQGFCVGLFIGFWAGGGDALVQHLALRWVLWRAGRMPWNYAKFLNFASEQGLLKRAGGCYRFSHDKLREHLAQHPAPQIYSLQFPRLAQNEGK